MEEVGKDQAIAEAGMVGLNQIPKNKVHPRHQPRLAPLQRLEEKALLQVVGPSLRACIIMEKVYIRVHSQVRDSM